MSILTPTQFATLWPDIQSGWNKESKKIQRCINEAESVDLFDRIGSFLYDIEANKSDLDWSELMNGSSFTYNGVKYRHVGIYKFIAGLTYVRYLTIKNNVHTSYGYVQKMNNDSEKVSFAAIKDEKNSVIQTLDVWFKSINTFICTNLVLFGNCNFINDPDISGNEAKTSTLR